MTIGQSPQALILKINKCTYEDRIEKDKIEKYKISYAAKFRGDGYSDKFGQFPTPSQFHLLEPLCTFDEDNRNMFSNAIPRRSSYSLPRQLPHHYFASSYVFHLDANTQPQLRELAKCSNLDYMYNDYHKTQAAFQVTFRLFIPNPVESKPYVDKGIEEDNDKKRCLQMAAEDMQSSFAETNILMNKDPMTLQLKHKNFISPYIIMLPQKLKYPFNDELFIGHCDPVKQYFTLESQNIQDDPYLPQLNLYNVQMTL